MKADALVTEPMRMQETGCGWCFVAWAAKSVSLYLVPRTLVATAHSSPMAEITVTCGEHTHTHHVRLTQREMSFILRRRCQQCAVLSSTSFSFQASEVTYHEFITRFELRLDFSADIAVGDAQVLPDVTVVAHQGHVVLVDVEQLRRRQQRS